MKIHTKIAIIFASICGMVLLIMSIALYYITNQDFYEDYYKRMEIRAVVTARSQLGADPDEVDAYKSLKKEYLTPLAGEKEYFIKLTANNTLPHNTIISLPKSVLQSAINNTNSYYRNGNVFYFVHFYKSTSGNYLVVVSTKNEIIGQYLVYLRKAMIISFIAAAIIAFTTGLLFSKRILKPITRITKRVQNITAYNLHLRLDVNDTTDEVTELAKTFNTMLDRLETAFETQNNFVSHASHEFNTPLTAIIGEAEYALARERTPEVYVQSIKSILQSAERLHGITQSLLQLAQTGLTDNVHEMNIIRIDYLLQEVVRMVQQIIPESVINFNDSLLPQNAQKLMIKGNEALLELAVSNILLNACKYSSNKPVQLALASSNKNLIIIVKDEGIGIPEDELKYIYDPFFRASNTNKYNGYGIGLPLTRNIIRIHKGELIVNSKQNIGTEIQIILPLSE